jgi:hypothetical protein
MKKKRDWGLLSLVHGQSWNMITPPNIALVQLIHSDGEAVTLNLNMSSKSES